MVRALLIAAALGASLGACASPGPPQTAAKKSVDAVVVDEAKRAEAAATAEATGSSAAGLASVAEGPKREEPVP